MMSCEEAGACRCGAIENAGDEDRLCSDITSVDVSNLTLPDHRVGLEARQCSRGRSERAEAKPRLNQAFDAPVSLLNDVVEIFALPHASSAPEFSVSLHLCRRPRVGLLCSAADANGPGDRFADRHRSLAEKFRIPFARLRPPIEGGDWNDVLRARSETKGARP